jgi:hypothetical protein
MWRNGEQRVFAALAGLVVACAIGVVGCGGGKDDDEHQTPAAADAPTAKGSPEAVIEQIAATLATAKKKKQCKAVEKINERSIQGLACPAPPKFRKSMRDLKVTDVGVYGSGAVVDYRSGGAPNGGSATLYVNRDKQWSIGRFGLLYGPTVGSEDGPSRAGFDRTMNSYLKAVHKRNCKQFRRYAATSSDKPRQVCDDEFPRTALLGLALKENKRAKPQYLGGNETIGFYNLRIGGALPAYYTFSVIAVDAPKNKHSFLVLNVGNGPAPPPELPPEKPKPSEPAVPSKEA